MIPLPLKGKEPLLRLDHKQTSRIDLLMFFVFCAKLVYDYKLKKLKYFSSLVRVEIHFVVRDISVCPASVIQATNILMKNALCSSVSSYLNTKYLLYLI